MKLVVCNVKHPSHTDSTPCILLAQQCIGVNTLCISCMLSTSKYDKSMCKMVPYNLHCSVGCISSSWYANPAPYNALRTCTRVLAGDRECKRCAFSRIKACTP